MEPRHVKPIPMERLAEMPTPRLLVYRDRLLGLEDTAVGSDWSEDELSRLNGDLLYFKDDSRWRELYDAVKKELSGREHVERQR